MKSKKQRRFERRVAERKLRKQEGVARKTGGSWKGPNVESAARRVRNERPGSPDFQSPETKSPGITGKREEKHQ
jgi:hypothetical protein